MTQFIIAGVRCQLEPESGAFVFGSQLTPFASPQCAPPDLTLRLSVAPGWREEHAGLLTPLLNRTPDGFEFIRSHGKLIASPDFSLCQGCVDPGDAAPFASQPWLMLALWGYLTCHRGLFLHGALCEYQGRHVLLLGDPEVGKSTFGRLILAAGGACLTDEYPFASRTEAGFMAHASPWPGVQGEPNALSAPLAAIFFLRHAPAHELRRLGHKEAAWRLIGNNRFFRWNPQSIPLGMELIDALAAETPLFDFGFVPEASAVTVLEGAL